MVWILYMFEDSLNIHNTNMNLCIQTTLCYWLIIQPNWWIVLSMLWFELEKENGPKTVKEVKLISAGKVLDNNKTVKDYRSPVSNLVGTVTTMHVIIQPLLTEKGKWKTRQPLLKLQNLFSTWHRDRCFLLLCLEQKRSLKVMIRRWTNVCAQSCKRNAKSHRESVRLLVSFPHVVRYRLFTDTRIISFEPFFFFFFKKYKSNLLY